MICLHALVVARLPCVQQASAQAALIGLDYLLVNISELESSSVSVVCPCAGVS